MSDTTIRRIEPGDADDAATRHTLDTRFISRESVAPPPVSLIE